MKKSALPLALCALLTGCSSKKDEPRERAEPQAKLQAPVEPAQLPPVLAEPQVRSFLEKWLEAQNAGDFEAYSRLYAERFTGIKRAGSRTARFDRAHWLLDRKSMFDKPFSVAAADATISITAEAAVIEFTQSWTSPTFRDVGVKRLVLSGARELSIASEEMRSSELGDGVARASAPRPEDFAFVRRRGGGWPVLLLESGVDPKAVSGEVEGIDEEKAERGVLTQALSPRWQELVGQRYALHDDTGKVCEATVSGFIVLIEVIAHFGTVATWKGQQGTPAMSPAAIALDQWNLSQAGGRFLAATLESEGCPDTARFARPASQPPQKPWASREPTALELEAILSVARESKAHQDLQKQFERAFSKKVPWDSTGGHRARVFEDGAGQSFASLLLTSGEDDSCASAFDAELWLLLQKKGQVWRVVSAAPEAHVASEYPRFLSPLFADLAFDFDGDGRPEFLSRYDFIREAEGSYRAVFNLSPGYFDCPC